MTQTMEQLQSLQIFLTGVVFGVRASAQDRATNPLFIVCQELAEQIAEADTPQDVSDINHWLWMMAGTSHHTGPVHQFCTRAQALIK